MGRGDRCKGVEESDRHVLTPAGLAREMTARFDLILFEMNVESSTPDHVALILCDTKRLGLNALVTDVDRFDPLLVVHFSRRYEQKRILFFCEFLGTVFLVCYHFLFVKWDKITHSEPAVLSSLLSYEYVPVLMILPNGAST